jgi:hypothetical protein
MYDLQTKLGVVFILGMLVLACIGDRYESIGVSYDVKLKAEEADIARRVSLLNKEKVKKAEPKTEHRAERMDDGLQGDVPVRELMEGMRGFL